MRTLFRNLRIGELAVLCFLFLSSCVTEKGFVKGLDQLPIEGTKVEVNGKQVATTNINGEFFFKKKSIQNGDVITLKAKDHVTVNKVYKESLSTTFFVKRRGESKVFDSKKDQTLNFKSGVSLKIPALAFKSSSPYSGEVKVTLTYFNPNNYLDLLSAPAAFVEYDVNKGRLIPLSTFGVFEVLAESIEGSPLTLTNNATIKVSLPAEGKSFPPTMPFYEMSNDSGYWIRRTSLQLIENRLLGEITSVNSAWNADAPCSDTLVCVKVKVVFANGNPGCGISATGVSYQGFDGIYQPDPSGYVQLMVCPNSVFTLGACHLTCCGPGTPQSDPCCNGPLYQKTIDLSTIPINPSGCTDLGTWTIQN